MKIYAYQSYYDDYESKYYSFQPDNADKPCNNAVKRRKWSGDANILDGAD